MKKNKAQWILSTAFLMVSLSSCVRSLYPITDDEKKIVFKNELLGHWKDKDGTIYFVDSSNVPGHQTYRVGIIDTNNDSKFLKNEATDTSYFIATLINFKGIFFLDCSADINQLEIKKISEPTFNSLIFSHTILRVFSIEQNSIEIASIDHDELSTLLNQKKVNISHESIDGDDILLTEKPKLLGQKLMVLEKFPSVYKDRNRLKRIM